MARQVLTRHDAEGVAVLVYDVPDERMNTLTEQALRDLAAHMAAIAADDTVIGAVLVSGKPDNFCAGADLRRLPRLQALDHQARLAALERSHQVLRAMTDLSKPLVCGIVGVALGGGLEIAMACDHRIAGDHPNTQLGLPEVRLGLLPGLGGTQHLPRLIGAPAALEHLLTGKPIYPRKALALGLVDEVVPHNQVRRRAVARVHQMAAHPPARRTADLPAGADLDNLIAGARYLAKERTGGLSPAPDAILDAVEAGLRDGLDAGLAAEREAFARLLGTPEAAAGVHLFLSSEAAKKRPAPQARPTRRVFVLGAGMMGGALGIVAADRGIDARVRDIDEGALTAARRHAEQVLQRRYGKRRTQYPYLRRERIHRLALTTDLDGVGTAEVVIEAVPESVDLKHRVIAEASDRMGPGAILASNTSALPIGLLAEASPHPAAFIGMHFFSPVDRMPLVEIIPHSGTSQATTDTVVRLALDLGKVPIVVADSPGFYTSRVFGRWLAEATRLLADGARIEEIDQAATRLGFPVGPLVAYDEVSLALAHKATQEPTTASVTADRVDATPTRQVIGALVDAGRLGRKAGRGFYDYADDGSRGDPAADVYTIAGLPGDGGVPPDLIADRLLWAFVSEALLCFDEGLLRSPADGDVGAVLGIGFPPTLGGPFFHADRVGAAAVVAALERLGQPTFAVADTLRELADSGGRYADR